MYFNCKSESSPRHFCMLSRSVKAGTKCVLCSVFEIEEMTLNPHELPAGGTLPRSRWCAK